MFMVKKNNIFICIKNVCMNGNPKNVAYIKNKFYISEEDGCITDEQNDKFHGWHNIDAVLQYFIPFELYKIFKDGIKCVKNKEEYINLSIRLKENGVKVNIKKKTIEINDKIYNVQI